MSTYKNISGDWSITVDGGLGTIYVYGDLDVHGNITYVSELNVNDAFIAVAGNNTGNVNYGGLIFTKVANTSFAGLRYNNVVGAWQISTSVTVDGTGTYSNIATSASSQSAAGNTTQVQFNDGGVFGATANLTFDKTVNQFSVLTGSQVLGNIGTAPTATSNAVTLYNLAPGVGASGVYARTSTTQDELISLTKARLFAIIF